MANYHIGRLTMDCILAERFQKFVHIENFVNSIYKSFKFIIATYNDEDTLPGTSLNFFGGRPSVAGSSLTIDTFLIFGCESYFQCTTIYSAAK